MLEELREKIDIIDIQILNLLNDRAKLVLQIGQIKGINNLPIYSAKREHELIAKIINENTGPLNQDALEKIYTTIMAESKRLQEEIGKLDPEMNTNVD